VLEDEIIINTSKQTKTMLPLTASLAPSLEALNYKIPEVNEALVARLKQSIKNGHYKISAQTIAKRLLEK
jgi:flagellar biosynthesis anti-sigma factor FlgM